MGTNLVRLDLRSLLSIVLSVVLIASMLEFPPCGTGQVRLQSAEDSPLETQGQRRFVHTSSVPGQERLAIGCSFNTPRHLVGVGGRLLTYWFYAGFSGDAQWLSLQHYSGVSQRSIPRRFRGGHGRCSSMGDSQNSRNLSCSLAG